jgi:hypothetical protein
MTRPPITRVVDALLCAQPALGQAFTRLELAEASARLLTRLEVSAGIQGKKIGAQPAKEQGAEKTVEQCNYTPFLEPRQSGLN